MSVSRLLLVVFMSLSIYGDRQRVACPLICVRLPLLYAMIGNQLCCSRPLNVSCCVSMFACPQLKTVLFIYCLIHIFDIHFITC